VHGDLREVVNVSEFCSPGGFPDPEPGGKGMEDLIHLLIVDDDEAIRSFFKEIFPEDRYRIDCATNGEEATKMVMQSTYDVVVTDLCMPKMDGIRLIKEIRKLDPTTVPVAITGFGTIKDAVSLMKTGAFDVLTKPFGLDEIQITIEKALRHHELARKNRELERKLKISEKLAAIGKLAAGVAHEINNPLDGVIRFVNLSLMHLDEGSVIREYLSDVRTGLDRIAGIVQSLLDFSRSIVLETDPQAIGDMVREALNPFRHQVHEGKVKIVFEFEDNEVEVPGGTLHVITNIVKNALDELPEGGELVIRSSSDENSLAVSVSDNGPGIPEDIREKIFEPFFTTKKIGKGTGLGLSICQQIVEKQGGSLRVDSEVGRGTTFTITLPRNEAGKASRQIESDGIALAEVCGAAEGSEPQTSESTGCRDK